MRQKREIEFNATYISYFLKKYWKILFLSAITGLALAFIYNVFATPLYKSEISIFTWNRSMSDAIGDVRKKQEEQKSDKVEELMMYNDIVSQSLRVGQSLVADYMTIINNPHVRQMVDNSLIEKGFKPPFDYSFYCKIQRQSCIMAIEVFAPDAQLSVATANSLVEVFKREQQRLMSVQYAESMYPATVPTEPSSPRKWLNLILGVLVGLVLGGIISLLLDLIDMSINTLDDVRNLGLLPLGQIRNFKDISTLCETHESQNTDRLGSLVLDAVRVTSTTISFLGVDNPPKVIVFTSALPGSGKSTLSLLLAKIKARGNMRGLLITCDLRKPFIHRDMKQNHPEGLVNYLKDTQCNDPGKYIQKHIFPGLDIMPHGLIPPNPVELLESKRFADMIKKLRDQYDFIFLDSPPCSGMADAMILGSVADAIILIIDAQKAKMNDILRTWEQFGSLQSKIIGAVLNKITPSKNSEYYYH